MASLQGRRASSSSRESVSLDDFYLPLEGNGRSAFRAHPAETKLEITKIAMGIAKAGAVVPFRHDRGRVLVDWINTTLASVVLISDRVVDLMTKAALTGWSTFPVELLDEGDDPVEGYHGLTISGRCGPFDDSRIPITLERSEWSGAMVPVRRGFYFDIETWDGSDFFVPRLTTMPLVTNRVRALFEKNKIKNVLFERLTESLRVGTLEVPRE